MAIAENREEFGGLGLAPGMGPCRSRDQCQKVRGSASVVWSFRAFGRAMDMSILQFSSGRFCFSDNRKNSFQGLFCVQGKCECPIMPSIYPPQCRNMPMDPGKLKNGHSL